MTFPNLRIERYLGEWNSTASLINTILAMMADHKAWEDQDIEIKIRSTFQPCKQA